MSFKNFAGMTVDDFISFKKQGVNLSEYFTQYQKQNEKEIKWTNAILRSFGYHDNNIPFTFKDNIYIKGQIASSGSKMLENFKAPFDSHVYELSRKNHLNIHAAGNMDEFAMGSHNTFSAFGKVLNPIDITDDGYLNIKNVFKIENDNIISPGGSGGGPLVAVSIGMSVGCFGTDTGGSLRGPAEWNGLCGLKPTFGNISRYGVAELASDLDTVSIAAKTMKCLKYFTNIFINEDSRDSINQVMLKSTPIQKRLATINYLVKPIITPEAYDAMIFAQEELRKHGYIIEEVRLDKELIDCVDISYSIQCYTGASSSLGVYNSLFYGQPLGKEGSLTDKVFAQSRSNGLGLLQAKRRSIIGKLLSSPEYNICIHANYKFINKLYQDLSNTVFSKYDGLIGPVNGITTFLNNITSGSRGALTSDIWLCMSNLFGGPGLSVPVQKSIKGIYGVQILGDIGHDLQLLEIGQDLDNIFKFNENLRGKCEYIHDNKYEFIVGDKATCN